jgi:hypothetical protein
MQEKIDFMKQVLAQSRAISAPVPIVPFADWNHYYILENIEWHHDNQEENTYPSVRVPRGFVTDLTSVPRIFWSLIPPTGPYAYAAIIHDFLYWDQYVDREVADNIFKVAMRELNVSRIKTITIFSAVRIAGGFAWKSNNEARRSGESRVLKKFPSAAITSWDQWKCEPGVF